MGLTYGNNTTLIESNKQLSIWTRIFHLLWILFVVISPTYIFDKTLEQYSVYCIITSLAIYLLGNVIHNFSKTPNILMFAAILAVLQWLVGPMIAYYIDYEFYASDEIMLFKVPKQEYFAYTLPATIAYILGLWIFNPREFLKYNVNSFLAANRKNAAIFGKYLFYIGITFTVLTSVLPPIFGYFGWLLSSCLQLAVITYWLFNLKNKLIISLVGVGILLLSAVSQGMFGELVYWTLFISVFVSLTFKISLLKKVTFFTLGFLMIFIISATKWQYRFITWGKKDYTTVQKISIYKEIITNNVTNEDVDRVRAGQEVMVRRLNQGGTISHIMDRVPKIEPYAKGETIVSAIATAIIPRLFWPNKPVAGKKDFYRFTGYRLKGTSMGITPIGEAYANFGRNGGIATMFFYGLFLSSIYRKLITSSFNKNSLIFIFIPIVFFRAIYAESDLMRTLTAATKGLMFVLIMVLIFRYVLNKKVL